jgi:hypothetical protein
MHTAEQTDKKDGKETGFRHEQGLGKCPHDGMETHAGLADRQEAQITFE